MRPYMRAANVTWEGIDVSDVKEMDFSAKEFGTYELKDGDILLSEASGSASEVGKSAIWRNEVSGCCFQNTVIRVRSRGPLPEYLHLHFLADARLGKFAVAGKGIGINHLGADRISSWPTRIPPESEQTRIVAKVGSLRSANRRAREALEAVPELIQKLRQSTIAAAFRGDLTRDWRAANQGVNSATVLANVRAARRAEWEQSSRRARKYAPPEEVDTSALPVLPSTWSWASLEELTSSVRTICYGVVQPGEECSDGIPLVRVCDIVGHGDGINIPTLRRISQVVNEEYSRSTLEGGELLVSVVGTIGRTAIAPASLKGANIARAVARLAFYSHTPNEWAMYWMNSSFIHQMLNGESRETARKTLNISQLAKIPVPIAPAEEMSVLVESLRVSTARVAALFTAAHAAISQQAHLERGVLSRVFGDATTH